MPRIGCGSQNFQPAPVCVRFFPPGREARLYGSKDACRHEGFESRAGRRLCRRGKNSFRRRALPPRHRGEGIILILSFKRFYFHRYIFSKITFAASVHPCCSCALIRKAGRADFEERVVLVVNRRFFCNQRFIVRDAAQISRLQKLVSLENCSVNRRIKVRFQLRNVAGQ
jgi:hypothetical protein